MRFPPLLAAAAMMLPLSSMAATTIRVDFVTLGPVAFADVAGIFQDGSFSYFTPGAPASPVLSQLAQFGNVTPLLNSAPVGSDKGVVVTGPVGPGPGSSGSLVFSVSDSNVRFTFGSMLLPSNDWFIGNSTGVDVSTLLNAVAGSSISFDVSVVWDAGVELEDFDYAQGTGLFNGSLPDWGTGDLSTPQNGVVTQVSGPDPYAVFTNNVYNYDTSLLDFTGGPVARFTLTVVPEPGTWLLGGLGVIGLVVRRQRRA